MAQNSAKGDEFINKEPLQEKKEAEQQTAAAESKQKEEDFGYGLYPERSSSKFKQGSIGESLFTFKHKCHIMLQVAMDTSPYAKLLLGAMKSSGCTVYKDRHFSCEDCDGTVSGGFDAATSQIVLCQNNIHQQAHMNRVVTHELIHAFDHCRARVDWFSNFRHLACSEIRAANLSGDCSFVNEISRFNFGLKEHHQEILLQSCWRSGEAGVTSDLELSDRSLGQCSSCLFHQCFHQRMIRAVCEQ
uniref:Mitochondrial inner membrane protease ATP23 n=1 Tax=Cyprinus carpio TaxID=7962 RepID=A0A8C2GNX0_CYPCA